MDSQERDAQVADLENERSRLEERGRIAQAEIDLNNEKIARLKDAKNGVKYQKDEAERDLEHFRNYAEEKGTFELWRGKKASEVYEDYLCDTKAAYDRFIDKIDDAQDALQDEITRLENKNLSLDGDLLYLRRLINTVGDAIAKLFN